MTGTRAKSKRIWSWGKFFRNVGGLLTAGLAIWLISRQLSRLSGSALWLPSEWRQSIGFFATMLGMVIFQLVIVHTKEIHGAKAPSAKNDHGNKEGLVKATIWIVAAIILLAFYMGLRSQTVHGWDMRQWYEQDAQLEQTARAEGDLAVPAGTQTGSPAEAKDGGAVNGPWGRPPDFIDLERREIYLPLWFPNNHGERDYLERMGEMHQADGMSYLLETEPDRVIGWLNGPWRPALNMTSILFLLIHSAIIVCFAAAYAYSYGSIEGIVQMLREPRG